MIYLIIGLFALTWGLLYIVRKDSLQRGKDECEKEDLEEIIDDVRTAKIARDALNSDVDGSIARQLREKYTRK